jgi:hypothetical protein
MFTSIFELELSEAADELAQGVSKLSTAPVKPKA